MAAIALGVAHFIRPESYPFHKDVIAFSVAFVALAYWRVKLPSGASWRPAMSILAASIFIVPINLLPLVGLPGLVLITAAGHEKWWSYPLTVGHVWLGLFAGELVYNLLQPSGGLHLPAAIPAVAVGLITHLVVNRLVSVFIVAFRRNRPLRPQLAAVVKEMNLGHAGLYANSLITALLYHEEGAWGLLLATAMLVILYQSVSYYSHMQQLQETAWTDGLTGVGNRAAFEVFSQAFPNQRFSGTVVMFDLDYFKLINDAYGHLKGDALLREVATSLQAKLRRQDRLFRYGGDEFLLFAQHPPEAEDAARQRILALMDQLNAQWREQGLHVSVSVGMASCPRESDDISVLVAVADERMYRAKAERKASHVV